MGSEKLANKRAPKVFHHLPMSSPQCHLAPKKLRLTVILKLQSTFISKMIDDAEAKGRDHINIETAPAQSHATAVNPKATHV
jgi:hypothetical protein